MSSFSPSERDYQRHVRNLHCNGGHQPQHARTGSPRQHLGTPSLHPETTQTTSQQHNSKYSPISVSKPYGARFSCGQTGQEMGCFRRPTPSDLACDDHQAGTTAHSGQFRIDPLFATSGLPQSHSVPHCGSGSWRAVLTDR